MELTYRVEDGVRLGSLLWEFGPGWRMISSALLGGGIGARTWVLNAQVVAGYSRMDPVEHLRELGPGGRGVGMMTAASVERHARAVDGGVEVVATVGLRVPTWAAAPEGATGPELAPMRGDTTDPEPAPMLDEMTGPEPAPMRGETTIAGPPVGTINLMAAVPVAMTDAALVNAVMTMTEAKSQALIEAGFPCTGTASDALCLAVRTDGPEELFGGPRSTWGARLARAVHSAVHQGALSWRPRT